MGERWLRVIAAGECILFPVLDLGVLRVPARVALDALTQFRQHHITESEVGEIMCAARDRSRERRCMIVRGFDGSYGVVPVNR